MTWSYIYNPDIWTPFVTALFLLTLSGYGWRRRSMPGALPFAIGCLFAVLWVTSSLLEVAAVSVAAKIFWHNAQAVWQLPAVTAITCFVLEYVWPGRWLTRRNLALVSVALLLVIGAILTNDLHHLAWRSFAFDGSVIPQRGPVVWAALVYGYVLGFIEIAVLIWLGVHSPPHRWPVAIMLIGQIGARAIYMLEFVGIIRSGSPLDVLVIVFVFATYAIALFGFRILDPIPLACQTLVAQMRDGVLVLDPQGRVASLNPAAQSILNVPAKRAMGSPIRDLLPMVPAIEGDSPVAGVDRIEMRLETEPEPRHFVIEISTLRDWRGLAVGCVLLLHDVTEQKQAQAQILEQQRALAVLQEHQLLAQELHDGLAQNLGFLNLQAQAAGLYLRSGQDEAAQNSLDRLMEVARAMQGDTRELVGDLLAVSLSPEGLSNVLRRSVAHFAERNGLPVSLEIADDLDAIFSSALPPAAGGQLLRIMQEALANVRKHAECPSQVGVRLWADAGQLQMTIVDNGAGLDPTQAGAGGSHYGLQVMRQRAERIGGQLAVYSAPGQGTRVEVCVPLPVGKGIDYV